ncbi:hypothetical protein KR222_002709, partial [Zaprionus bogoriensis]
MTPHENEKQQFNRGEKVLCYEPDESKAKVLYDSKVLAVYERKDEQNRRYFDYKIHFQGWSSTWDRNVRAAGLLKDNEANRKLQRELAEAAQLQKSGGYTYKDTKTPTLPSNKKKRMTRGGNAEKLKEDSADSSQIVLLPADVQEEEPSPHPRDYIVNRSRDNSGERAERKRQHDKSAAGDAKMKDARNAGRAAGERKSGKSQFSLHVSTKDTHTPTDADKHVHQEDRVMLRISERLREYMEYDHNMICKLKKHPRLPAHMPIVIILENFVKQRAVELAIGIKQDSSRQRNTQSRNARMEREYDRVMSNVCMIKEVVDGLRIYFEFHLEDHLLYNEEKTCVGVALKEENMMDRRRSLNEMYAQFVDTDTELITMDTSNGEESILGGIEYEKQLQKCLLYIVKNIGKNNMAHAYDQRTSPYTAAYKLPMEMRGFLWETFNWRLLSAESPPEKSMIFGAPYLARMLVKLPEYLNASPISNEKLEDLLPHLNSFINYLENHKEWFDKDNYTEN